MTTDTVSAADRAAQLAERAADLAARRASLAADLAALDTAGAELSRDAASARPDLERQHGRLAATVGTLTRSRRTAVAAGDDAEATRRLIAARVELDLADADLAEIRALAATAEAAAAREQRAVEYEHLLAGVAAADTAVTDWTASIAGRIDQAAADTVRLVDELVAAVAAVRPAYDRAAALRAQARIVAAEITADLPGGALPDPVEQVSASLGGDRLPLRRLLLAAARGRRADVLAAIVDAVSVS